MQEIKVNQPRNSSKDPPAEASLAYHSYIQYPGLQCEQIRGKVLTSYIKMDKGSPHITSSLLHKNGEKPLNRPSPILLKKKVAIVRPKDTSMQQHGSPTQRIKYVSYINKQHTSTCSLILMSLKQIIYTVNAPLNSSLETCAQLVRATDQSNIKMSSQAYSLLHDLLQCSPTPIFQTMGNQVTSS